MALLALFGTSLDEDLLRTRLRDEGAEDALEALRRLLARGTTVDDASLERVLGELHLKPDPAWVTMRANTEGHNALQILRSHQDDI